MSRKQTFEWYSSFKVARLTLRTLNIQASRRQFGLIKTYKKLRQVIHKDKTTDDERCTEASLQYNLPFFLYSILSNFIKLSFKKGSLQNKSLLDLNH